MKALQRSGGLAALYLAAAYLIGMVLFLVMLDYSGITDPAQKVALLVEKQAVIFSTNLLMYVFFGVFLVVLALALYDRLKPGALTLMQVATALGLVWAGSLVASGMVKLTGRNTPLYITAGVGFFLLVCASLYYFSRHSKLLAELLKETQCVNGEGGALPPKDPG